MHLTTLETHIPSLLKSIRSNPVPKGGDTIIIKLMIPTQHGNSGRVFHHPPTTTINL